MAISQKLFAYTELKLKSFSFKWTRNSENKENRRPIKVRGPSGEMTWNDPDCPTIPISSGLSRFCLKIPNPDQSYAIGIGKIPISTRVVMFSLNSHKRKRMQNT